MYSATCAPIQLFLPAVHSDEGKVAFFGHWPGTPLGTWAIGGTFTLGAPISDTENRKKEQGYDVARMAALICGFPMRLAGPPSKPQLRAPASRRSTRRPRAIAAPVRGTCRLPGGVETHAPHPQESRVQSQPPFSLPSHGQATLTWD